ncbi:MAG: hypothetical protein H7A34_02255 [bacterium]|nr:hypothetical protein [bacterium]
MKRKNDSEQQLRDLKEKLNKEFPDTTIEELSEMQSKDLDVIKGRISIDELSLNNKKE